MEKKGYHINTKTKSNKDAKPIQNDMNLIGCTKTIVPNPPCVVIVLELKHNRWTPFNVLRACKRPR